MAYGTLVLHLDVVGVNLMFGENIEGAIIRSSKKYAATTVMS
jgi:hypothetical protein